MGAVFIAVALGVTGCTGVPDREDEALAISERVTQMPGVDDVGLIYDNGVLEGTRFELRVDMETATDAQIGAVAAEINTARGDDFAEYDQRIELDIGYRVSLSSGAALPDDTAALAGLLRELDSRISDGEIEAFSTAGSTTGIDIRDATGHGATIVDAALEVFADRPLDRLEVHRPNGPDPAASWWIRSPLTADDKHAIDAQLAAAGPAVPRLVVIRDGRVEKLNVSIASPETAYADITAVIAAFDAGPARRLDLGWSWIDDPARYGDLRWSGNADIGACHDPNTTTGSSPDLLPEAKQFQQRIRDEFSGCPK